MATGSYQMARHESAWHRPRGTVVQVLATTYLVGHLALVPRLLMIVTSRSRSAAPAAIDVRPQASDVLKSFPGHAFCDDCLAAKIGYPLRDVRRARIGLAGSSEFEQEITFCSVCLEQKHVIHVAWLRFDVATGASEDAFEA